MRIGFRWEPGNWRDVSHRRRSAHGIWTNSPAGHTTSRRKRIRSGSSDGDEENGNDRVTQENRGETYAYNLSQIRRIPRLNPLQ